MRATAAALLVAAAGRADFLPFAPNNSRAFYWPSRVAGELRQRADKLASLPRPLAADALAEARNATAARGFAWNALGVAFPIGWDFESHFQTRGPAPRAARALSGTKR